MGRPCGSVRILEDAATVILMGEIDRGEAPEPERLLAEALSTGAAVVLDLSGVTFIDGALPTAMLTALSQHPPRDCITVVGAESSVLRILTITGLVGHCKVRILPAGERWPKSVDGNCVPGNDGAPSDAPPNPH